MKKLFIYLLVIIKSIFMLLLTLINRSVAIIFSKNAIASFVFYFLPIDNQTNVIIEEKVNKDYRREYILYLSYLAYIVKYFYICPKEQVEPMSQYFSNKIRSQESIEAHEIYKIIFDTMNPIKQDALKELEALSKINIIDWNNGGDLIVNIADKNNNIITKHTILLLENKSVAQKIGYFSDVLLPLITGLFYTYICKSVNEKFLQKIILDLLNKYETVNCRSLNAFKLPEIILQENNIKPNIT